MLKKTAAIIIVLSVVCMAAEADVLPTVSITSPGGKAITSRDTWQDGCSIAIKSADGNTLYFSKGNKVKLRGHSSFAKAKKPFSIKLDKKHELLGMKAARRWVLLANVMDHSFLRNALAFSVSSMTSLDFTPEWRIVNVEVNGKRQGNYTLTEAIKGKADELSGKKGGGFLIEMDAHPSDEYRFFTAERHLPVNVKYPKSAAEAAKAEQYVNAIERILYSKNPDYKLLFKRYIDMKSFCDWWIIHELTQNAEPNGPRSCFFHKKDDSRLKAGPVWDFDLAFITLGIDSGGDLRPDRFHRTDVRRATGDSLYNARAIWFDKLLESPKFRKCVKSRWRALKPKFETLVPRIDAWAKSCEQSAAEDKAIWPDIDPAKFDTFTDFHESVANLKRTYSYRINSLDRLISAL